MNSTERQMVIDDLIAKVIAKDKIEKKNPSPNKYNSQFGYNVGKASNRNYKAMSYGKLMRCVEELEVNRGDAYNRVINTGCDPVADLQKAKEALLTLISKQIMYTYPLNSDPGTVKSN